MSTQSPFFRDTWVEVNINALNNNIKNIKNMLTDDVEAFAVVKANGYGHGDIQVAKAALQAGANGIAVAFLDEAINLREHGVTEPILVLGATRPEYARVAAEKGISLTVFEESWIQEVKHFTPFTNPLALHIKCDTGMNRLGIKSVEALMRMEEEIESNSSLVLEGVFTHFATSDEIERSYTKRQIALFHDYLHALKKRPRYVHAGNSGGALRFSEAKFNMVRIGIAMYGLTPSPEITHELPVSLSPVMSIHTKIVHIKELPKGEKISYGATYETQDYEWIATIPIGYADGWLRKLQGQEVLVEGERVPIVGRICMDQCMIKLPREVPVGTIVTLIGTQGSETITMEEIADKMDTINYEVPCIISTRVPRVYRENHQTIEVSNRLLGSYTYKINDME
ncbi:alanine racemase [Bacillus coahuilensis p1.1.43]|uniref:Alanine racemase n=1 Tax=Bacillus coahuilensis p1.1.43 TaxID=1150625 RepID=A0A147K5E4_9BACI|nr:alanine racemase [Bacillus coahuilensis]KUP04880.1 alanine racemase [Bacillus coahuilensis p1.1.43]